MRVELEVLRSQRTEQAAKVEGFATRQREIEQVEELVGQTAGSLEAERQKALLLVSNFSPALAAQLNKIYEKHDGIPRYTT